MSPLPQRGFALAQETPHGAATDKLFDSAHLRASGTQQIEKLSGSILQYRAGSNSGQLLVDFQTITPVQIIPQVPTCRVSASTINLPLGNVFFPSSTPVGTTASEQAFNISLNRAGGQQRNGVPGIQRNRRSYPDHQARYSIEIRPELRSRGQYQPVVCRQRRIWARQTGYSLEGSLSEDRRPGDAGQGQWRCHIHDELSVARSGTSELLGNQRSWVHWAALT